MLYYKASCTSTKLEFGVADIRNNKRSMGGNPKSSSALLLSWVSGSRSTQRHQFQVETPLSIHAASWIRESSTGSNCSKLRFRRNTRLQDYPRRVLQLRFRTTRPAASALSLSSR